MQDIDSGVASLKTGCDLAIVIGINEYTQGIPPLANAVRDAAAVAHALEGLGFEVLRLLDAEASLATLSGLLSGLLSARQPPDRLLVYFAGHGLAHTDGQHRLSGFLLPADARRDEPSTYWPMAALREALRALPCRHLLLILDCCFAGAFPHSPSRDLRAPSESAPLSLERFRHFSSRRSFQLLVSTAYDELASDRLLSKPSQENQGNGCHSPFALALLQALRHPSPADANQDGLLTASELTTFLRDRLFELLPSHSKQTPGLWPLDWHDSGEFLFLLSEALPPLPPAVRLSRHSNPYLGLKPFSSTHRHLFFGRERLVDMLLEHVRARPVLLLCGPSGAGKSSTVHAGLLPRLGDDPSWRVPASLRPSSQPLQALSTWLASLEPGRAVPSARDLSVRPRAAVECVQAFLSRHDGLSLLLVVDTFEELVTSCLDDTTRQAFLRTLGVLIQLAPPRLRLLGLLRSDFEPRLQGLLRPSGFTPEHWQAGRLILPPMNRDELRRCIEKPAEACVLFLEPGLTERLLDDVEQMPGALPLLSVALSELFDAYLASGRGDRTLSFEDYQGIGGGIAGALQRRAELVFAGVPPPVSEGQSIPRLIDSSELPAFQHTLRNVLLRMVSPNGGALARRRVPRTELEYAHSEENARVRRALHALEASRLVVASDDEGPCVEPAHEALLSAWPRLNEWARSASQELLLLRRVSQAASEWHCHHHGSDFLWADGRLDQLGLALAGLRREDTPLALATMSAGIQTQTLDFNAAESDFLRASAARRSYLSARRSSIAFMVGVAFVLLSLALFQADQVHDMNNAAQSALEEQKYHAALAMHDQHEAQEQKMFAQMSSLEAARRLKVAEEAYARNVIEFNQRALCHGVPLGHGDDTETSQFNLTDDRVLAFPNDETARPWKSDGTGNPVIASVGWDATRLAHSKKQRLNTPSFNSDSNGTITTAHGTMAFVWKNKNVRNPRRVLSHKDAVGLAIFNPKGTHVLTLSRDGIARLWETDGSNDPIEFSLQGIHIHSATFNKDGSQILTICSDNTVRLWNSLGQGKPIVFQGHTDTVNSATFSPDDQHVLTASSDGTARLWDATRGSQVVEFTGHTSTVNSAIFSSEGNYVLTTSNDGTARLWQSDGVEQPLVSAQTSW